MLEPERGRHAVRVAVLDHTAELGGAELALMRLIDALPVGVAEILPVLFSDGPLATRLRQSGLPVVVEPLRADLVGVDRARAGRSSLTTVGNALRVLPYVWRLGQVVRRLDVDVIHTTSLKADLIGVPVACVARRPLVWYVHDRISPDYLPAPLVFLVRTLARLVPKTVIANSRATAATLPGVRDLRVAYPGVSRAQVGASGHPDTSLDSDHPVVGIIGRVSETKGQVEFVRAAALVSRIVPEARFRIIGSALFGQEAYARLVRAEVDRLGLTDVVTFTGWVADPTDELDRLTAVVHASTTPEPFGQVVVEAMVRGVPVVATEGGGVTEIVDADLDDPTLGWLVPPGDVDALAGAILDVLADPAAARRRAAHARDVASRAFSVEQTAAVVADVWTGLAGSSPRLRRTR